MSEIREIYRTLKDLGLCDTQAEFSLQWLGRSAGYFAYLQSTGKKPDRSAVGMLSGRLVAVTPTANDTRWFNERSRLRTAKIAADGIHGESLLFRNTPPWL